MNKDEVLVGYIKPWLENALFLEALRRCNEAKENFKPLAGNLTPEKLKQFERNIKEKK